MKCCSIFLLTVILGIHLGAMPIPSLDEIKSKIRPGHPRLFLTEEQIPVLKKRALTSCRTYYDQLLKEVEQYPDDPKLEIRTEIADIIDGKLVFKPGYGDMKILHRAVKRRGGVEALKCTIVYLVTENEKYRKKALQFLRLNMDFFQLADHSRIMPEWYHHSRLSAIIAWDWLYNTMTESERISFMKPLLHHIESMQRPGYTHNAGGYDTGNYGEPGLLWFAGLAAYKSGVDDSLAEKLLSKGYQLNVKMMNYREKISGGTGVLTSICSAYSFGAYPWATFNFMHTLQSAAGVDASKIWFQMRDYANYFLWMMIPDKNQKDGFSEFGWGDSTHRNNQLFNRLIYTHLAQVIHFYPSDPEVTRLARAIQKIQPEPFRRFLNNWEYPYPPFVLTGFDPEQQDNIPPEKVLCEKKAAYFPSYGLTVMRSGIGFNDTYAAFKGGAKFAVHTHYDDNTFIIYKKGFQALDSGTRGNIPHHLVYYPQTVAHNGILIRMNDEPLPPYWYAVDQPQIIKKLYNDGGQNRQCSARSLGFEQSDYHVVTGADATASYSEKKCKEAVRQFVYLVPDYFVIYDRVTSVLPDQQKVFLLHTQNKPELKNGIWRSNAGKGSLFLKTLLPKNEKTERIGGAGKEFWTNGKNWPVPEVAKKKSEQPEQNWLGRYRLEISSAIPQEKTRFLTVIQAADEKTQNMVPCELISEDKRDGVILMAPDKTRYTIMFNRDGLIGGSIRVEKAGKRLLERPLLKEVPVGAPQSGSPKSEKVVSAPAYPARIDAVVIGGSVDSQDRGNAVYSERPRWLNHGNGYLAQFKANAKPGEGIMSLKIQKGGMLVLSLMGPDIRKNGKYIPHYIHFLQLCINGKNQLTQPVTVSHAKPFRVKIAVKDGDILKVNAVFHTVRPMEEKSKLK